MKGMIWGAIGLIIAVCGAVYLIKQLYLKKKGSLVLAEVIDVSEDVKRKAFIHTLKFELNGKMYECRDKAGYSQPFKEGEKKLIICHPKNPEKFEFEADVKKNIIIVGILIGVAVIFSVRWFLGGMS